MDYKLLRTEQVTYLNGWEVMVEFSDPVLSINRTKMFFWEGKDEPTLESMSDRLSHISKKIIEKAAMFSKQQSFERTEIDQILKSKGFIENTETIEDLKTLDELRMING